MSWVCRQNTQQSFFCITARVNIRNSTSDILDLKLWVQNPELKNMSSVFRTWKTWVQFSGLKLCGRDLENIKENKSKKISKFQKRPKTFPSVQTCYGANFLKKFFCPVFHRFIESLRKNQRKFKIAKMPKIVPKMSKLLLSMFCGNFFEKKCPVFHGGSGLRKFSKNSKIIKIPKKLKIVSKSVHTCFEHALGQFFRIFFAD